MCTCKDTGRFYIGYRKANKVAAHEDLGIHYFTSSIEVSNNFNNFAYEILSEYDSALMAFEVEQVLIYEHRSNPLLINKNFKTKNHITLDPKPVQIRPSEKYKKHIYSSGPAKRSEILPRGVKKRKSRERRKLRRLNILED